MADNSAALTRTRRIDGRVKRARAKDALQEMIEAGELISFPALARRAGVSVSLLYADKHLASRVADARDRQRQVGKDRAWRLPARSLMTEQSLRTELANAKEQIRLLHEEVRLLRSSLARNLGASGDLARGRAATPMLDDLENRAAELESANVQLGRQVSQLRTELQEANDSLEAARTSNRDLMSLLNR